MIIQQTQPPARSDISFYLYPLPLSRMASG